LGTKKLALGVGGNRVGLGGAQCMYFVIFNESVPMLMREMTEKGEL